jgi:hypothetical protein
MNGQRIQYMADNFHCGQLGIITLDYGWIGKGLHYVGLTLDDGFKVWATCIDYREI